MFVPAVETAAVKLSGAALGGPIGTIARRWPHTSPLKRNVGSPAAAEVTADAMIAIFSRMPSAACSCALASLPMR